MSPSKITISQAFADYIDNVSLSRSVNTARTYKNALNSFGKALADKGIPPETTPIHKLTEQAVMWFARELKGYSPSTERLYLNAVTLFYEFLVSQELAAVNMHRVRSLIQQHARRAQQRLPQFPRDSIEKMLDYANKIHNFPAENDASKLRNYRDRAFLLVLADTGLRVHEACSLRRGDIDWLESRALVIGKAVMTAEQAKKLSLSRPPQEEILSPRGSESVWEKTPQARLRPIHSGIILLPRYYLVRVVI